jgi:hypothetical protein
MPFRDREWEDFQRDSATFPAYTDYIFGPDTRPEVENEPGLHPQIFDPQPLPQSVSKPPRRLYGLPPPVQYPAAYDPSRDGSHPRRYGMSALQNARTSLLRQESSSESMQPSPSPAPRMLPASTPQPSHLYTTHGPPHVPTLRQDSVVGASQLWMRPSPHAPHTTGPEEKLLRPDEIIENPMYSVLPRERCVEVNKMITQAWDVVNSDAIPQQKAQAMGFIKDMSRGAAARVKEYGTPAAGSEIKTGEELGIPAPAPAPAPVEAQLAIHDLALPDYFQACLPQIWHCTKVLNLDPPPTNPDALKNYQDAERYMWRFEASIPKEGHSWSRLVTSRMILLYEEGDDPLKVLQSMQGFEGALR